VKTPEQVEANLEQRTQRSKKDRKGMKIPAVTGNSGVDVMINAAVASWNSKTKATQAGYDEAMREVWAIMDNHPDRFPKYVVFARCPPPPLGVCSSNWNAAIGRRKWALCVTPPPLPLC
jgi:hypothetical protein